MVSSVPIREARPRRAPPDAGDATERRIQQHDCTNTHAENLKNLLLPRGVPVPRAIPAKAPIGALDRVAG